jgi:hypothetical protein
MKSKQLELGALPVADPEWESQRLAEIQAKADAQADTCADCLDRTQGRHCRTCEQPICDACLDPDLIICGECLCAQYESASSDACSVEEGEPVSAELIVYLRAHFKTVGTDVTDREAVLAEVELVFGVERAACETIAAAVLGGEA